MSICSTSSASRAWSTAFSDGFGSLGAAPAAGSQQPSAAASGCSITGLATKASMPASRHTSTLPAKALAVRAITGRRGRPCSVSHWRSQRVVASPSSSGIWMSIRIASGASPACRRSMHCRPLFTHTEATPRAFSSATTTRWLIRLSSTTITRPPSPATGAWGTSSAGSGNVVASAAGSTRTRNQKRAPSPAALSSPTLPPIRLARLLTMDSPSPVPLYCRVEVLSAWENCWNSRCCLSTGTPTPVSVTANSSSTRPSAAPT